VRAGAAHGFDQIAKLAQRLTRDRRRERQCNPTAYRYVKHPSWNLDRMAMVVVLEHTAIHRVLVPDDRAGDEHRAAVPRMPAVEDYSRLGNMGALSSTCTTGIARIKASKV